MIGAGRANFIPQLVSLSFWVQSLGPVKAHICAALLGAFSVFAFAPFHFIPAFIIAVTGLIWLLDGAYDQGLSWRSFFSRGWAFAFGFFLCGLHWVAFAFLVDPEKYAYLIFLPLLIGPAYLAIYWGLALAILRLVWSRSPARLLVFCVGLSLAEYIRGSLFGGFPWNLPGTIWVPGGAVSQLAALGGVYGLSVLTLLVGTLPAALISISTHKDLMRRLFLICLGCAALALSWTWGAHRLQAETRFLDQHVALMDAGPPQKEKWEMDPSLILVRYLDMLKVMDQSPSDIVIWPESAIPVMMLQEPNALDAINAYLGERVLILGTLRRERKARPADGALGTERLVQSILTDYDYFNSLILMDKSSGRSGPHALYDKHRLVPFGELAAVDIIPFGENLSAFLPPVIQQATSAGFVPGIGPKVLEYQDRVPRFLALICYEAIYPNVPRDPKGGPRPDWMINISNDASFGRGLGPAQHYAQNRYRAIETGLPLARVASRGRTALIDGLGRETAIGSPRPQDANGWVSSMVRAKIPKPLAATFYFEYGNLLFFSALFMLSLLAFFMQYSYKTN